MPDLTPAEFRAHNRGSSRFTCYRCSAAGYNVEGGIKITIPISRKDCDGRSMSSSAPGRFSDPITQAWVMGCMIANFGINPPWADDYTSDKYYYCEGFVLGPCGAPLDGNCDTYYSKGAEAAGNFPYELQQPYTCRQGNTDNFYLNVCDMFAPYAYFGGPNGNQIRYGDNSPYNPYRIYPREEYVYPRWRWKFGPSEAEVQNQCQDALNQFFGPVYTAVLTPTDCSDSIRDAMNGSGPPGVGGAAILGTSTVSSSSSQSLSTNEVAIQDVATPIQISGNEKITFEKFFSNQTASYMKHRNSLATSLIAISANKIDEIKSIFLKPSGIYDKIIISSDIDPQNPSVLGFGYVKDDESDDVIVQILAIELNI